MDQTKASSRCEGNIRFWSNGVFNEEALLIPEPKAGRQAVSSSYAQLLEDLHPPIFQGKSWETQ